MINEQLSTVDHNPHSESMECTFHKNRFKSLVPAFLRLWRPDQAPSCCCRSTLNYDISSFGVEKGRIGH
jgi:hypothetical protein